MPVASQKILGTWASSSALLLFLRRGCGGQPGPGDCAALSFCLPQLSVFPAESIRQHKNSQVIGKVTYCPLSNGRRGA